MAQRYYGATAREVDGAARIGRELTERKIMLDIPFSVAKVPFGFKVTEQPSQTAIGLHINALEGALAEVLVAYMAVTGKKYTFETALEDVYFKHFHADGKESAQAEQQHFRNAVRETWKEIDDLNRK